MHRRKLFQASVLSSSVLLFGCRAAPALESHAAIVPLPQPSQAKAVAPPAYIWIEAENPKSTNFPPAPQHPFAPANPSEAEVLSGGKWIGVGSDRAEPLFLEYEVTVPAAGAYNLYARKFWKHGPFRWRIDQGEWREVGAGTALLDEAPIRQFVVANWVACGEATLTPGKHTLRVELKENRGAAAFDAFLLTSAPFTARGKMKPGEKYNRAPEGWFAFEPDPDPFRPGSPIDLRNLNEKAAGDNGFIQAKGDRFVHGKTGQPVRFWAINSGNDVTRLDRASLAYYARSLAKQGVNLVRLHGGVWEQGNFRRLDKEHRDRLQYFVSALKKEGIYTCLSIYFPLWLNFDEKSGFPGYTGGKHPFALLYFNPEFQEVYRGWWRDLLTAPNPYAGGKPLRDDPALAMVEMVNEDSYFFWTFTPYENIPGPQMALLEKAFGDWAAKKYGSLDKAMATWKKQVRGDELSQGRAGFMPLSVVFNEKGPRAQDTARFLAEHQKAFYEQTYRYLKNDLGYRALVYASNWITADARVLGPLDKYSNTVADFMDRHGYFGGPHEGERASYSLSKGDRYDDRSALLFSPSRPGGAPDFSLPIMDIRYNGQPSTISEINWTPPNRYRADLPLLSAAYGSLQGTDTFFFFATASPAWEQQIGKFSLRTPVIAGQFPATAFLYRKGLVKEAEPVIDVNLALEDLYALKGAPVSAPVNLDELRAKDIPAGKSAPVSKVDALDPLSFLVGKVSVNIAPGSTAKPAQMADLSRYIDRKARTVRSATGELAWNWGTGRVILNAPGAQGITGFLSSAGTVALKDVSIEAAMEYGTVLLVALDGKPLAQSRRMLLQVMTEDKNYGFEAPGQGLRTITEIGAAPVVVKDIRGTISLHRPDAARLKVTALDFNGYPVGQVGNAKSLSLRPEVLYYLIEP